MIHRSATPFFKSFVGSADSKDEHPSKKSPEFKSLSEEQLAIANLEDALNNNFFEDNKVREYSLCKQKYDLVNVGENGIRCIRVPISESKSIYDIYGWLVRFS